MTTAQNSRPNRIMIWFLRVRLVLLLVSRFLIDMIVANFDQIRIILTPSLPIAPTWLEFPTRLNSRLAQTTLGAMISMTPGTLTCDCANNVLTLHVLQTDSEEGTLQRIAARFEEPLLRLEELA